MKKLMLLVSILVSLLVLTVVGTNVYLAGLVGEYNNTISFAGYFYPVITDNTSLQNRFELNPLVAWQTSQEFNSQTVLLKSEITAQFNALIEKFAPLNQEITELTGQAQKLSMSIPQEATTEMQVYATTTDFNETKFQAAKEQYDYLVNYHKNLKNLFVEYKQVLTKQGKFVNPLWGTTDSELQATIASLSNEAKAGQLLMISLDGLSLNSAQIQRYQALAPGGVILMGKNIADAKQVQALTKQIQKLDKNFPVFIGIDEEGGVVKRIPWDTTAGQKSWAGMSDADVCNLGKQRSQMLGGLGFNMNFSPVADLGYASGSFMNNRSISTDAKVVSAKVKSYVTCGQEAGILDTIKHYPGHGPTTLDSHYKLPLVNKNKSDWLASDAIPFKENLDAKVVMAGHLVFSQIDKDNPSSLSPVFLTDILRKEWNYQGLVITDDMNMLHNSAKLSVSDALKRSVNAGVDIVLYVGTPTSFEDVHNKLTTLIATNEISQARVNEALERILKAKRAL